MLDPEPYVRKTAILGCLKLFYFKPESIVGKRLGYLDD
jgi:vesicle coat complex subunit